MLDSGFLKAILIVVAVLSDMRHVEGSSVESSSGHVSTCPFLTIESLLMDEGHMDTFSCINTARGHSLGIHDPDHTHSLVSF